MGATAGYLLPFQNERFYASQHFSTAYQSINVRHVMDVVLHDGRCPLGTFLLMRDSQQGAFTPDERNMLVNLIPILNNAFITPSVGETQYAKKETVGFALISKFGNYRSMNEEARRIVWMLNHTFPNSFANPNDVSIERHLEQLTVKCLGSDQSHSKRTFDLANRWGKFHLSFERQSDTLDTIVTLRRKVPLLSQLVFALSDYNLPPIRLMVAWLLAQNKTRNQIAEALHICVDTVTDHIKLIYKATGTNSSHGLLLHLEN